MIAAAFSPTQSPRELLEGGLEQMGLALNENVQNNLLRYVALLDKWNKVYNLAHKGGFFGGGVEHRDAHARCGCETGDR